MDLLTGRNLNRYKVIELIGEGGMGSVYKAYDTSLHRDVAIKVMHSHFARQSDLRERFMHEARTAASMNHPSIVKVYDIGQENEILYIVMEFIPGNNLGQMLAYIDQQGSAISTAEAVYIVREISLAVHYAHQRGVLHRDIKPSNIMMLNDLAAPFAYRPVLTDLGLAKILAGTPMTQTGVTMGTPAYMSPEQALGENLDARSDVYSLGILLYELCVGKLPFPVQSISDAIRYHTKENPSLPEEQKTGMAKPLQDTILKCLEKQQEDRFNNAIELANELKIVAEEYKSDNMPSGISILIQNNEGTQIQPPITQREDGTERFKLRDYIQLQGNDHSIRNYEIEKNSITFGRSEDNDVQIDNPKVSRHHARLDLENGNYYLIDLESSNGTYLGDTRLLPGVPELWLREKTVRIGDNWLNLIKLEAEKPEMEDGTLIETTLGDEYRIFDRNQRVHAVITPEKIHAKKGDSFELTASLINQGEIVDHFEVYLRGVPQEWVSPASHKVQLMPGNSHEIKYLVEFPKDAWLKAGENELTLEIISESIPDDICRHKALLFFESEFQYEFNLVSENVESTGTGIFEAVIKNTGNAVMNFQFIGKDEENICEISFEPSQVSVKEAEEKIVRILVSSHQDVDESRYHMLTFEAIPIEFPKRKIIHGKWMQKITPLVVSITPSESESILRANCKLSLENLGNEEIHLKISMSDKDNLCEFELGKDDFLLPAKVKRLIDFKVKAKELYPPGEYRQHTILVDIIDQRSGLKVTQASAVWIQKSDFSLSLEKNSIKVETGGYVNLFVENGCNEELEITLSCKDIFSRIDISPYPKILKLKPGEKDQSRVNMIAKTSIYGETILEHKLVLQASSYDARLANQKTELIFNQLPSEKSGNGWKALLIFILGNAFSWLISILMFADSGGLFAILIGILCGIFTTWGLKTANPRISKSWNIPLFIIFGILWIMFTGFLLYGI